MKATNNDIDLGQFQVRNMRGASLSADAATYAQAEQSKGISVYSPVNTDNIALFYTPVAMTLQWAKAVLRGSATPTVQISVYANTDRSTHGTALISAQTVTSVTTGGDCTLAATAIPAGSWVWVEVTAVSGTVNEFHLTLGYRIDA